MSHNANRQEDRNIDRGFDPRTWRNSTNTQRVLGVVAMVHHAAIAASTPSTPDAPGQMGREHIPAAISQEDTRQRIQRVRQMAGVAIA